MRPQVTAYRAGHVLGAAMFMVEIGGMRCLYTGDYSRVKDRHLDAADLPEEKPHIGGRGGEGGAVGGGAGLGRRQQFSGNSTSSNAHRCL
jgi:hypothetical protein